jgi:hypothetical protein
MHFYLYLDVGNSYIFKNLYLQIEKKVFFYLKTSSFERNSWIVVSTTKENTWIMKTKLPICCFFSVFTLEYRSNMFCLKVNN